MYVPIGNCLSKSLNREIGKNQDFVLIFKFWGCISIFNVKIQFLSKFYSEILIFEEVTSFFVVTNLQGQWSGFTKIAIGNLQRKAVTFEIKQLGRHSKIM